MHYVYPHSNFGYLVQLVDWLFGTVGTLRGRRVAMTGSQGALGQALVRQLSLQSVKSIRPLRYDIEWSLGVSDEKMLKMSLGEVDDCDDGLCLDHCCFSLVCSLSFLNINLIHR
jgi:hypothetical protein